MNSIEILEIATIFTLIFINLVVIITTTKNARWQKCADYTDHYMNRYDCLMKDRTRINIEYRKNKKKKNSPENQEIHILSEDWWNRFWKLQQEQHQLWQKKCIYDDFFQLWMKYREKEFKDNYPTGGIGIHEGWNNAKKTDPFPEDFKDYIENIILKSKGINNSNKTNIPKIQKIGARL